MKMYKGNATMVYEINGNDVTAFIGEQKFVYTTAQWIAVSSTLVASGWKTVNEKPQKTNAVSQPTPKKTWEEHLEEQYGDKDTRKHFIEVRNRECCNAMRYFREAYKKSGQNWDFKKYKTEEKKFVNKWTNRVIASEQK